MSNENSSPDKKRPVFRINFCPKFQKADEQKLGRSIEIGAAWMLDNGSGYRMSFNIVPQNLSEGVMFLNPVMDQEQKQSPENDIDQEME